jgi:hypothetical protein
MSLNVNHRKTKIMVFKRSRRKKTEFKFDCRGKEMETVKEYENLGLPFKNQKSKLNRNCIFSISVEGIVRRYGGILDMKDKSF